MSNYLILGGTGPIGTYLANELCKNKNDHVYITSRQDHAGNQNMHYIKGDAHNSDILKHCFYVIGEIDAIVDCLVWKTTDFKNIHELILSNCEMYVYISTSRLYSGSGEIITENTPDILNDIDDKRFIQCDTYAVPKIQQEMILKKSRYDNYIIVRPYITYSEQRLPLGADEKEVWLYRVLHGRSIVISNDIANHYTSLTHGDDCAKAICSIIKNECTDKIVNISLVESLKWNQVLDIYSNVLVNRGYKVKIKHTDTNIKAENIDYQVIYDRCFNRRFNTELLSKYMDTESMIGMEYGLAQSLNTFLNNPEFNPKMQNWSYQAELDKIAGEYADYKEFQTFNEWGKYILLRILPISKLKRKLKNVYYFGKCKNCDKTIKRA